MTWTDPMSSLVAESVCQWSRWGGQQVAMLQSGGGLLARSDSIRRLAVRELEATKQVQELRHRSSGPNRSEVRRASSDRLRQAGLRQTLRTCLG
ncbi:hypothetical protein [Nostoc sp. FACHB-133]|uniref:hypothetical protein n=1 Tax=Nostoc sp. FACHB-133 TaxID=2692835 RepID=UPI0016844825|nr:hypothetical protein [Nostoc sp. FACHB-133]MBD2526241.1 hypothetical protein [Nostoc sp. FACHB-133]